MAELEQIINKNEFSVKPLNYDALGVEEKEYFSLLDSFQAPYLEEKLLSEGTVNSSKEYQELFCEFKKYVALLAISRTTLGMVGKKIDKVWHQFILFTREYHKFSQDFFGSYIHHSPNTSKTILNPDADKNFFEWYHKLYGCIPKVWKD